MGRSLDRLQDFSVYTVAALGLATTAYLYGKMFTAHEQKSLQPPSALVEKPQSPEPLIPIDPRIPLSDSLAKRIQPLGEWVQNLDSTEVSLLDCSNLNTAYKGIYYPGLIAFANYQKGALLTTEPGSSGYTINPGIPAGDPVNFNAVIVEKGPNFNIASAVSPVMIEREIEHKGLYFGEIERESPITQERKYRLSLLEGNLRFCKQTNWGNGPRSAK